MSTATTTVTAKKEFTVERLEVFSVTYKVTAKNADEAASLARSGGGEEIGKEFHSDFSDYGIEGDGIVKQTGGEAEEEVEININGWRA